MYIKTFDINDVITGAEKINEPIFVRWQSSNGQMVACDSVEEAQGIVAANNSDIYLLNGAMPRGEKEPYAEIIDEAEYQAIIDGLPDPEDEDPEIPDDDPPAAVPTRAELARRVGELEDQLEAAKILLGVD